MNPRYRVTALAFLSLSAGSLWVSPARADAAAPFKVDPRLLGLPALEEPVLEIKKVAPVTATEPTPKPEQATALQAPPPSPVKPLPAEAAPVKRPAPTPEKTVSAKPTPPAKPPTPEPGPTPAPIVQAPPKPEAPVSPSATAISAEPPALPPADLNGIPLRLQPALALAPHPTKVNEKNPVFISAQRLQGKTDTYVEAEEDVELRKLGLLVNADTLRYDEEQEIVDAKGHVRLQSDTAVAKGPDLHYKLSDSTGLMNTPAYALGGSTNGQGVADKLNFLDKDRFQLEKAKYSTCGVGQEAWWIHASELEINRSTDEGIGHNAWVEFKGVPLLYTPYISFSLNNDRASGFLTPSFGTSNTRGVEFSAPYYWNIAPNYDATISPRIMTKRGLQLGGEFRYLQPNYTGEIQAEVLPDSVTHTTRTAFNFKHSQNFGAGFSGNIDYQKVSDNNYYRDLSTLIAATSKTTLPHEGNLYYGNGPFTAGLKVQRFQVLQDPITPVVSPYERVPQITANYRKLNAFGFADVLASSEYVHFSHPTSVEGSRFTLYPSFSVPLTRAYGYITPKIGLHYTQYNLSQNQNNPTRLPNTTRTLPIFSLDSGLTFERESSLFGEALKQTLEPRFYYVYVPYKNQNQIPLFDSAETDFSFAQVFSENRFSGGDRISDANQATFALTSRFIEDNTGLERLRVSVAQRYFFSTPKVTITPTTAPPQDKASDFLASIGGQITPAWSADAALQYNPNIGRSEKYNIGTRYSPELGKVANFNYRYTRDSLHQVDFSGQWPIDQHWQVLGRWNYSIQDRKTVESLAGFEYKASCWAIRVVGHRFQTATQQSTNALFLQLELSGLSSLGTNPFNTLKQNIGGYSQTKPHPEEINLNEF